MSGQRTKPRAQSKASKGKGGQVDAASKQRARANTRPPTHGLAPPLALGAAAFLFAACAIPFVLWGNPYPENVVPYWILGGVVVVIVAALSMLLRTDPTQWLAEQIRRPSPRVFAASIASGTLILSVLVAVFVFRRGASTSDELAELWHARILLSGHLSLPVDPNREFFSLENVVDTGRWYSQFPIGGPLFVAAGALFGVPWLVNPILAGASAALFYHFARRAFGEMEGRVSAVLFALAPMILMMAGTWMNHVPVLFLTTGALAALVEWVQPSSPRRALALAGCIGLAIGGIAITRPLDAVVVAAVIGTFQLWTIRREPVRLREIGVQAICGAIAVTPLLYANWATTGSPLTFGYDMSWGAGHRVGFHTDPYGNPHTLGQAFEYAVTYLSELNMYLMAWPIPVMLVVIAGLLLTRRTTRWDALVLGLLGAQVAAYAAYWGEGEFLGPRFLFTALPAVIILIAKFPFAVADRFTERPRRAARVLMVACVAVAWAVPVAPYNVWGLAAQAHGTRQLLKLDVASAVRSADVHNALVFVREPFGARLSRRLWGVGMMRSDAAQLLATRDACSVLTAVRRAETDSSVSTAARLTSIVEGAAVFAPGRDPVPASDRTIRISSKAAVTPECQAELDLDARGQSAPFGPALPLEPIGHAGQLDGDVIYAADLGERNERLRSRFDGRQWYRLIVVKAPEGGLAPKLERY